jgi:hypothetical protein
MKCKNKAHGHGKKRYNITYIRKSDGQPITKQYEYDICYTCQHRNTVKATQYNINKKLINNRGLTELERELIRILRGKNEPKNIPNLFKLNRVIESSLRKRNTL